MLLPLVVIFFSFCKMQAMEDRTLSAINEIMLPKHIVINTMTMSFDLPYEHNTTILDIKKKLEGSDGIPIYLQKIIASVPSTDWYFNKIANFMATKSDELGDDSKISEIVENYGPDITLELYLKSHKNPYKNN
jgi:hypothetical protein